MKEWVKKLDIDRIRFLAKKSNLLEDVPREFDEKLSDALLGLDIDRVHRKFSLRSFMTPALAAAALLAITIPIILFVLFQPMSLPPRIVLSSGDGYIIRDGETMPLAGSDIPCQGDFLYTESASRQILRIGKDSFVSLGEKTKIKLEALYEKKVSLTLDYGQIEVHTICGGQNTRSFEIESPGVFLRLAEAVFSLHYEDDTSEIAVYRGIVEGTYGSKTGEMESFQLKAGESMIIREGLSHGMTPLSAETIKDIVSFPGEKITTTADKPATLFIRTEMENVTLLLDNAFIDEFTKKIMVSLPPGDYRLTLQKEEYTSHTESIILKTGETLELSISQLKKTEPKVDLERLRAEVLYSYEHRDNRSRILGFCSDTSVLVAITKASVLCFYKTGELLWKRKYGEKEKIIFDSLPIIHNRSIYVPANYKILVLDSITGKEKKVIEAPGILSYGYTMVIDGAKAYIPYPDGIYMLDLLSNTLSRTPVFIFENPTTPILHNGNVYVSSFVKSRIAIFNAGGKMPKEFSLDDISICSPVMTADCIYIGDMAGKLYKLSGSLDLIKTLTLSGGITSIANADNILFVFTNKGTLFTIDEKTYTIAGSTAVDENPDERVYLFKKPLLFGEYLFIGTDGGDIKACNRLTGREEKTVKGATSPVSCSLYEFTNMLVTGTIDGDIIGVYYQ